MYCSRISEIIQGECFILTSLSPGLFTRSLDRPELNLYVSHAAGSICGAKKVSTKTNFARVFVKGDDGRQFRLEFLVP